MKSSMRWGRRAFLIELLFSMTALGICAAICLAGFVRADTISSDSQNLSQAVIRAQSAAEAFRSDPAAFVLDDSGNPGRLIPTFYDENWNPAPARVIPGYTVWGYYDMPGDDGLCTAQIDIAPTAENNEPIEAFYSLTVSKYLPVAKGGAR